MHTRRSFLKSTTVFSAGIFAAPAFPSLMSARHPTIGLQLYTVRDAMAADAVGTLAKVAQIGYNSLEGATYTGSEKFYGMDPVTFRGVLKNNGLVMRSCHYRYGEDQAGAPNGVFNGTILHDWDRTVEDAHTVGLKYMACAWLSPNERKGLDHYKKLADDFNVAGRKCKDAGIQFVYHNHDFEFIKQDEKYPYDVILDNTDRDLVKMEVDLYWLTFAGQDPVKLFEAHPGRFPLWHLKDMDSTPERKFTSVGSGVIDFKTIFAHRKTAGMKYFFVEEDRCPGSPFDAITSSYNYIKTNLV
ncbi:MAG TPA: sugar phosphate isomerase/epimerase [Puia sp.]|nr:sugar phosphate isomerase/epimerase [Puia sp.]